MEVAEILKNSETPLAKLLTNSNVSITITASDLIAVISEVANIATRIVEDENKNITYTATQVSEILGVTKKTLWDWNERGYLKNFRVGKSVRYNKIDIDRIKNRRNI